MAYQLITIKPTIAASKQHAAGFVAGDLLFDWVEFKLPKLFCKLTAATISVKDHTAGKITDFDTELYFSKRGDISLGTVNATVDGVPRLEDLVGTTVVAGTSYDTRLDKVSSSGTRASVAEPIIIGGQSDRNFYIAGASNTASEPAFASAIQVNEADFDAGAETVITVDGGVDIRAVFAPGDIIHAHDDAVLGTVASVDGASQFTLTAANTEAIEENDYLYNIHPMVIHLGIEY